ncbi:MAG: amidinotransferase [Flavobacteriaceae bacterium]|jgi:N-dimethylarginine dimethylaminohydrolase|nr:amidinotransferase [Pelagibacterales bacterium]MBT4959377.1 amidinotransferase [Flavobacteriaceae bacterium]MBT6447653.1 amidinotransferase [Flavobacteriaceae bacterium]MBT7623223.1 amidinotransferase [Flavobacteriaceae bacterium]
MIFSVNDETSKLDSVIIGIANSSGGVPDIENLYDPKSIENLKKGEYPLEIDMINELENLANTLKRNGVEVFRPNNIINCNQIFTRDIGFVIENYFFKSNILPKRSKEFQGIEYILNNFNGKIINIPENVHVEGGDVLTNFDDIFIGYYDNDDYSDLFTARTNRDAVNYFKEFFPKKNIKGFHLKKSNTDALNNVLHLDCCLQLIGKDKAIIYPEAFTYREDYQWLESFFGIENIFLINNKEMYQMNSNILSINHDLVISDPSFKRLNAWLELRGFTVEKVAFNEISKQEGLFRCSSLPLIRN